MAVSADLDSNRLANESFKRGGVPGGRPQLELCLSSRPNLEQVVLAAIVQLDAGDLLGVAAIEAFGEPQDGRECPDGATLPPAERPERLMAAFRRRPPMIAGNQGDRFDFFRLESP